MKSINHRNLVNKLRKLIKARPRAWTDYKYLKESITQYASKMKLWNGTDLLELLSVDERVRKEGGLTKVEALYSWPWSGGSYVSMYKKHRAMRMPFHFLPSCSRFEALLSPYDWIFAIFGRAIRGKGSGFKVRNWRNGPANKFLFGMFLQLGRHRDRGQGSLYWKCGWRLMKSHAYQVSAFNYVHNNWHREMDLKRVNKVLSEVKHLVETRATEIDFKRVYIPKANGKLRPLGVPSLSWRVYLHMLNNLVVWNRIGSEGSQHAYFPGRGVQTAWSEIFEKIEAPCIYEFDLTGFFDNVDLSFISKALRGRYSVPDVEVKFFEDMNRSLVKLASEDLLPEPDRSVMNIGYGLGPNPNCPVSDVDLGLIYYWDGSNYRILSGDPGRYEMLDGWENVESKEVGVPQGAATSCSLSTIAIHEVTDSENIERKLAPNHGGIVMYADDGVIFLESSDDLSKVLDMFVNSGVSINESKSGWVKKDGKWLTDLKFCGIKYSGIDETIKASTREGATLEFGLKDQFLAYLLNKREKILLEGSAGHLNSLQSYKGISVKSWVYTELANFLSVDRPQSLLFKGRWSGYFLSSLYCDSWDRNVPSDVELTCTSSRCWVKTVWPRYRRVCMEELRLPLLENKLKDLWDKLVLYGVPNENVLSKEFIWDRALFPSSSLTIPEKERGSRLKLLALRVKEATRSIRGLSRLKDEIRTCLLAFEHFLGDSRGFTLDLEGEILKSPTKFVESTIRNVYVMLGSCLELNIYNSSSFACDSLLRDYPFELASHGHVVRLNQRRIKSELDKSLSDDLNRYDCMGESLNYGNKRVGPVTKSLKGPRYHFYYSRYEEGLVVDKEIHQKAWEEMLPSLTKKLKQRISSEFKRNFGVGSLKLTRGFSTFLGKSSLGTLRDFRLGGTLVPSWSLLEFHRESSRLSPIILASSGAKCGVVCRDFFVGSYAPSIAEVALIRLLVDLDQWFCILSKFLYPWYGFLVAAILGCLVECRSAIEAPIVVEYEPGRPYVAPSQSLISDSPEGANLWGRFALRIIRENFGMSNEWCWYLLGGLILCGLSMMWVRKVYLDGPSPVKYSDKYLDEDVSYMFGPPQYADGSMALDWRTGEIPAAPVPPWAFEASLSGVEEVLVGSQACGSLSSLTDQALWIRRASTHCVPVERPVEFSWYGETLSSLEEPILYNLYLRDTYGAGPGVREYFEVNALAPLRVVETNPCPGHHLGFSDSWDECQFWHGSWLDVGL